MRASGSSKRRFISSGIFVPLPSTWNSSADYFRAPVANSTVRLSPSSTTALEDFRTSLMTITEPCFWNRPQTLPTIPCFVGGSTRKHDFAPSGVRRLPRQEAKGFRGIKLYED